MSEEIIISYASDILVKVRHNQEVSVVLTSQGPQGPQGEKGATGTVTVELQALYDDTVAARDIANGAKDAAAGSATAANTSKTAAATSATNAKASETASKTSETNAKASETAAALSKTAAATSEVNAKTSETEAKTSETNAAGSKNAALTSAANAKTSETNAWDSKVEAKASEDASALSKTAASASATGAAASATDALASKTAADTSKTAAAVSAANAKTSETAADGSNTSVQNAKTAVDAAKTATETARDLAQSAKSSAETAKTQAETARDVTQTAKNDAVAAVADAAIARDAAEDFAAAAAQSAADAAQFDPTSYPMKRNNGSDFEDPAQFRINIGAATALVAVTQAEAEAGTAVIARDWTSLRVRQSVAAYAPAKIHTHTVADITGLQALINEKASLASPVFTGAPTVPTAAADNSSLQIANTAFVKQAIDALVAGAPGALDTLQELADALGDDPNFAATMTAALADKSALGHTHTMAEITDLAGAIALLAPKASPVFTGNATATTQATADNSTRLATTAHVKAAIAAAGLAVIDHTHAIADVTGLADSLADKSPTGHKHLAADITDLAALLLLKAPLASPALTGTPTAPTQAVGNDSTRVATTAFVVTAVANGVSNKADTDHTHAIANITDLQGVLDAKAPLASPAFSGSPTAPTQAAGNNSTRISTTAFVTAAVAKFGTDLAIAGVTGLQAALEVKLDAIATAAAASKLATARAISLTGGVTGSATFDGSANASIAVTVTAHTHTMTEITGLADAIALLAPKASPTFTGTVNAATIVASGNITAYSDERLKTDIETISGALDMVGEMRGVRFTMNGHRSLGVVAQEFQKVAPELVHVNDDEMNTLSVAYGNAIGILIEAIKELKVEVDELKRAA